MWEYTIIWYDFPDFSYPYFHPHHFFSEILQTTNSPTIYSENSFAVTIELNLIMYGIMQINSMVPKLAWGGNNNSSALDSHLNSHESLVEFHRTGVGKDSAVHRNLIYILYKRHRCFKAKKTMWKCIWRLGFVNA